MSEQTLQGVFDFFWADYSVITPDAPKIHALLNERGETIVNDHIAFRTFDIDPIGVEALGSAFTAFGYSVSGEYHFEKKKLRALSYAHPDPMLPHIFISELLTGEFSAELQEIVRGLAAQIPAGRTGAEIFTALPTWKPVPFETYKRLLEESEYAGWLSAFGIRVNHFTVLINALKTFGSLQEFNSW
ncbi:MAG: DUF1338 domain-containing protein, partial [Candidatus Kapaibacterium sp.]